MKALCLLSGGIDSTTALFWAKKKYRNLIALSFDYGQKHSIELSCAKKIAKIAGVEHRIIKLDFSQITSALTSSKIKIPVKRTRGIPPTWVPQRNTIFLAYGFAIAELNGCNAVIAGINVVDYSGYPDCRPEFLNAFEKAGNLASKQFIERRKKIKIVTPFLRCKKSQIIKTGLTLGVPYQFTWSCYKGKIPACGRCDSCRFRLMAFKEAGIPDPIPYEHLE
jgi:7-cyano-7-deazaguanine synthase